MCIWFISLDEYCPTAYVPSMDISLNSIYKENGNIASQQNQCRKEWLHCAFRVYRENDYFWLKNMRCYKIYKTPSQPKVFVFMARGMHVRQSHRTLLKWIYIKMVLPERPVVDKKDIRDFYSPSGYKHKNCITEKELNKIDYWFCSVPSLNAPQWQFVIGHWRWGTSMSGTRWKRLYLRGQDTAISGKCKNTWTITGGTLLNNQIC